MWREVPSRVRLVAVGMILSLITLVRCKACCSRWKEGLNKVRDFMFATIILLKQLL